MMAIVTLLVAGLAILNVAVILAIVRTDVYSRNQKVVQSLVVWLLPVFGAVVVYAVYRSSREPSARKSHHVSETNTEGEYAQSHNAVHDP